MQNINKPRLQSLITKRWRARNSLKVNAHRKVYTSIRNGTLKQLTCKVCGKEKTEAHHEDYLKPLDVIWVCKKHHRELDILRRKKISTG
jgi:hypothetical protein